MAKIGFKQNINIGRVVAKIVATVLGIYVGGMIITEIGNVMNGTASPFNNGLRLIGWTVSTAVNSSSTQCSSHSCSGTLCQSYTGCITDTQSAAGILSVVGLIGIASVVIEFVEFKM